MTNIAKTDRDAIIDLAADRVLDFVLDVMKEHGAEAAPEALRSAAAAVVGVAVLFVPPETAALWMKAAAMAAEDVPHRQLSMV